MKRFLIRALCLALPFVALVGAFELRYASKANSGYAAKRRLLETVAGKVEILTLGSSHGLNGIRSEFLGGTAFNLAHVGQTLYYDDGLIRKYVPKMPNLKTVILPVSDFSLESQLDQQEDSKWRCYFYYRYFSIPHRDGRMAGSIRNFILYFLEDRFFPFYRNPLSRHDASKDFDEWGNWRESDWDKHVSTHEELQASAQRAVAGRDETTKAEYAPENIALLGRLADYLRERNIRLVLVTAPTTPEFLALMHPAAYTRMQDALSVFSKHHGVQYVNCIDDRRFTAADFRDSNHLNYFGAEKFSRIVAHDALGLPALP